MLVKIYPPKLEQQKTRLASDVAAGATSSTVENNAGFAVDDYIVFGNIGEEKTEIVKITSVSGNDTIGHTTGPVFAHAARTPIAKIKYNQAKIYRASSESGTYSLVTTVDLRLDEEYTSYDDTTGTSASWYKIKYYNSTSATESDYSSAVQGTGYTEESLYSMVGEVLEEFGDPDAKEISRNMVRSKLRGGVRNLTLALIKTYPSYRLQYTTQDLTADTDTYDLPTRFLAFQRIDVNYDGTDHDDAYKVDNFEREAAGEPDTTYYKSDPRVFFRGEQWGLRPTPDSSSGRAWLYYWDYPATMTDDSDTHGLPYGAREPLVLYALWRLWLPKDKEKASYYRTAFKEVRGEYIEFVGQTRQNYTPRKVEVVFGNDLYDRL